MLASLTPCLRQRSAIDTPASCSFKIPMICSSVNDCASCSGPRLGPERTSNWIKPEGQGHLSCGYWPVLTLVAKVGLAVVCLGITERLEQSAWLRVCFRPPARQVAPRLLEENPI